MPAKLLASEYPPIARIVSAEATEIITDILCDNAARRKSFGLNSPLAFEERVAAKTGTSSGFRDAWTVGFDKEHTVAVWAGNFDGRPMRDTLAIRTATPLWVSVMQRVAEEGSPGRSARAPTSRAARSAWPQGGSHHASAPEKCPNSFCAEQSRRKTLFPGFRAEGKLLLPGEYAAWCTGRDNTVGASIVPEPRIINPLPNSRYEIDPELPRTQQMIELTATIGNDVRWHVNGAPVFPQRDGRFFWQLAPGEWELQAIGQNGAAREKITVE